MENLRLRVSPFARKAELTAPRAWLRSVVAGLVLVATLYGLASFGRTRESVVLHSSTNKGEHHAAHTAAVPKQVATAEEQARAASSLRETQTQIERLRAQGIGR